MVRRLVVTIALVAGGLVGAGSARAQPTPAPALPPPAATPEAGRAPPARVLPAEDAASTAAEADAGAAPTAADGDERAAPPSAAASSSIPPRRPEEWESEPRGFKWRPFGYLRAQLTAVHDDPDVAFVGHSDGFSLQNARLGVRGSLQELVAFEVSLDGAVDERDRINLPNGRLRVGLRDAYIDLGVPPMPLHYLTVRVGRFEAWFDPDGYERDTARPFIDRALESHGVSANEGWETEGLPPGRSMGAAVRVRPLPWRPSEGERTPTQPTLIFEVAAMNGADEFASANDNGSLALSAAGRLLLPGRGWAQAAARYNDRTEGELPFRQDEQDLGLSLGLGLRLGPVQGAAGGVLVRTSFPTTGGSSQRAWGAHGQAMWRFDDEDRPIEVGYRFAILDPSSLVVTDRLMEHTLGAVLGLPKRHLRVLVNLTHAVEQEGRHLRNSRGEVVVELVL